MTIVLITVYFGWRIIAMQKWMKKHTEYVRALDIKWDIRDKKIFDDHRRIIESENRILEIAGKNWSSK